MADTGAAPVSGNGGGKQPHAAVAPDGRAHVVWASGDAIYCATAPKVGDKFGDPVKAGDVGGLMAGMRRGPRVAATADAVVAAGIGKSGGDLAAFRSEDGGKTWAGPVSVNGAGGAAREGMADLCASPKGAFHAAWLDLRAGKTQIWAAASSDHGATWKETKVYESPSGSVCECCNPAVSADGSGKVYVLFRNSIDGSRDMFMAASPDGGKTWGKAGKVGNQTWKLAQCPMSGGSVASASGKPMAIWTKDAGLFLSPGGTGEQPLGNGRFPWIAAGPGGSFAVWQKGRDESQLFVMRPKGGAVPLADRGAYAVVAGDPKAGAIAAWEADGGIVAVALAKGGK